MLLRLATLTISLLSITLVSKGQGFASDYDTVKANEKPTNYITNILTDKISLTLNQTFTLRGKILDQSTKRPIANVKIRLKGEIKDYNTDSLGHFYMQVPPGGVLTINGTGYESIQLQISTNDLSPVIYLKEATGYWIVPTDPKPSPFYKRWWNTLKRIF